MNVGFGMSGADICHLIESWDVVGLHYGAQTGFEDGLKKVREWFVENWADIERGAEF